MKLGKNKWLYMTTLRKLGRPKGSKKEVTLSRIIPTARRFFADKGFSQTTFKDIGNDLGISHAALYSYFPSKKALYIETVSHTQAFLLPHYINSLSVSSSLRGRISYIFRKMAEEHDKDSSITGLLASIPIEMRRHEELYAGLINNHNIILRTLISIFDEANIQGEIIFDANIEDLVSVLLGGGVGIALFQYCCCSFLLSLL